MQQLYNSYKVMFDITMVFQKHFVAMCAQLASKQAINRSKVTWRETMIKDASLNEAKEDKGGYIWKYKAKVMASKAFCYYEQ